MSPKRILSAAKKEKLDILGICDHNSSENSQAIRNAAKQMDIHVIPGMEITSQEEVHILALFDETEDALKLQDSVYRNLPGKNDKEAFGMQVIVNEREEVLGFNEKLLIGATTLSLEEILQLIHSFDGVTIASHIDREAFSIISQLGFIPENLDLDALEISPNITYAEAEEKFKNQYPIIRSSDAHYPDDIGRGYTSFFLKDGTVAEIKKALKNENGRKLIH
jgi:predicted metal-dependent phosphoesterase TrpH